MKDYGFLNSGGLFIPRPRSVTLGIGIAIAMAGIELLTGLSIVSGSSRAYTGMNGYIDLSGFSHSQGYIILLKSAILIPAALRALRPARNPRFITIGLSAITGLWYFFEFGLSVTSNQISVAGILKSLLMIAPALLLITPAANEFYGE